MEKEPRPQSVEEALQWHAAIADSVRQHRGSVLAALRDGAVTNARFIGLTEPEIDLLFEQEHLEVEGMCIVNIVAAAEASVRSDYRERVRRNQSDDLSKAYVAFKKTQEGRKVWRPDFDKGGILEALKESGAVAGHLITSFRHTLQLRHWYAHGRYWLLKTNATEDPLDVYSTCRVLLDALAT